MPILVEQIRYGTQQLNLESYLGFINASTEETNIFEEAMCSRLFSVTEHIGHFMKMGSKESPTTVDMVKMVHRGKSNCQSIFDSGATAHLIHDDLCGS